MSKPYQNDEPLLLITPMIGSFLAKVIELGFRNFVLATITIRILRFIIQERNCRRFHLWLCCAMGKPHVSDSLWHLYGVYEDTALDIYTRLGKRHPFSAEIANVVDFITELGRCVRTNAPSTNSTCPEFFSCREKAIHNLGNRLLAAYDDVCRRLSCEHLLVNGRQAIFMKEAIKEAFLSIKPVGNKRGRPPKGSASTPKTRGPKNTKMMKIERQTLIDYLEVECHRDVMSCTPADAKFVWERKENKQLFEDAAHRTDDQRGYLDFTVLRNADLYWHDKQLLTRFRKRKSTT